MPATARCCARGRTNRACHAHPDLGFSLDCLLWNTSLPKERRPAPDKCVLPRWTFTVLPGEDRHRGSSGVRKFLALKKTRNLQGAHLALTHHHAALTPAPSRAG